MVNIELSASIVDRIRNSDSLSGFDSRLLLSALRGELPAVRKSFADIPAHERNDWVGRFADFVVNGETHTLPVVRFAEYAVYPVRPVCGVQAPSMRNVFPREDLPRAFNVDGSPVDVDGSPVDVGEFAPGSIIDDHSQLEDAPIGTVIVDTDCDVMKKAENGSWVTDCGSNYLTHFLTMPVVILPLNVDFGL